MQSKIHFTALILLLQAAGECERHQILFGNILRTIIAGRVSQFRSATTAQILFLSTNGPRLNRVLNEHINLLSVGVHAHFVLV